MFSKVACYYLGRSEISGKTGEVVPVHSVVDPVNRQTVQFYGSRADRIFSDVSLADGAPVLIELTVEWRVYDGKWKPIPVSIC